MKEGDRRVTIKEVAQLAKVSSATVSRVLNMDATVNQPTRQRVINAAAALGYVPKKTGNHAEIQKRLLVMNIPSANNVFYSGIIAGAQVAAASFGYHLLVNVQKLNDTNLETFLQMLRQVKAIGLIDLNPLTLPLARRINEKLPFVRCCEYDEDCTEISYVGIDDRAAARRVMEHILSLRRRKIAVFCGPEQYKYTVHRKQAVLEELKHAGLDLKKEWVIYVPDEDFKMALTAATNLLSQKDCPDAVFAMSDMFAAATIRAAKQLDIKIPEDIIVTGFDDIDISACMVPSITTVRQPRYQLGFIAVKMLIGKIENNEIPYGQVLNADLILRESTQINQF